MKKLLILINPVAGHGYGPRITDLVTRSGISDQFQTQIISTEYAGHARELTKDAVKSKVDVVVAVGGDGTVNEIASALFGTATTLGIIPAGSGNGLARHIGMNIHPLESLRQLIHAKTEKIDSLSINGRFAVNVSGFGFDGYVAWLFNKEAKRGLSTYTKIALKEYFRYPIAEFNLTIDGRQIKKSAHMLVIANASQFGNAAIIAPRADLHDGLIDLVIVKRPPVLQMPSMFYRLFTGKLKDNQFLQSCPCKKFSAVSSRPLHLHIDGEGIDPVNKIDVEINPASLNILIPKNK